MKVIVLAVVGLVLSLFASAGIAQDKYPSRPITLVCGFLAGGAVDVGGRLIAEYAREKYGATVGIEYKPGASGTIAAGQVVRAKPDGYTLHLSGTSALVIIPHLQSVPYNPLKDFTYIANFNGNSQGVYVRTDSPFKSFKDVIEYARANPGKLRWGTAAARSASHIVTELAFRQEGVRTTLIPFTGGAALVIAVLGGHVELGVSADYGPQLDAGKFRLLAETTILKVPNMPEVPTYAELGYPLTCAIAYGLAGPAGLPKEVVTWWETLIKEMMKTPAYARMAKTMRFTPYYEDSETFTRNVSTLYKQFSESIDILDMRLK